MPLPFTSMQKATRFLRLAHFYSALHQAARSACRPLKNKARQIGEWRFDHRWGVETRGMVFHSPDSDDPLHRSAERYEATLPRHFNRIMRSISHLPMPQTFYDIGCGKGRILLMAAQYGFRRVVGIEFDPSLSEMAKDNVSRFRARQSRPTEFEVVCHDAGTFTFPDENALFYFFNPFKEDVMANTLENIRRSAGQNRERYIVYLVPKHLSLMDDPRKFALVVKTDIHAVYRMIL